MSITTASPWHCGTVISEQDFVDEIRRRGALVASNPLWRGMNPETAARQAYLAIAPFPNESAELWLEIAQHEHTFGMNPSSVLARNDTASWTNARSVRLKRLREVPRGAAPPMAGTYQIVYDASRRSDYVRYANVIDSLLDGIWRVRDPQYAYANARTIGEVVAIWAPGDDDNDPAGYARTVADGINATRARYAGQEPTMPATIPKPPMVSRPSPNRGGYSTPRVIEAICNHIATSTISSNLGWLTNPASGASCNAYIGKDGTIYQLVPLGEASWTNGKVNRPDLSNPLIAKWVRNGWNPNTRTYNIEHEGEAGDTLTAAQIASNNRVTAWVASIAGIPINRTTIIGHYQIDSVDRPYCPSFSDAEWRALVDGANALLNASQPQPEPSPTPDPNAEQFPTGYWIVNDHGVPFLSWFRANGGWQMLGYPLEGMHQDDDGVFRQLLENVLLEGYPNGFGAFPGPHVRIGGLGQRYRALLEEAA